MAIVTFKLNDKWRKFKLLSKAEDLLKEGHDVTSAASATIAEGLCERHIAKDVCA